jgi:hypothetical protein
VRLNTGGEGNFSIMKLPPPPVKGAAAPPKGVTGSGQKLNLPSMPHAFLRKFRHPIQEAVLSHRQFRRPDLQGDLVGHDGLLPSRKGKLLGSDGLLPSRQGELALLDGGGRSSHGGK